MNKLVLFFDGEINITDISVEYFLIYFCNNNNKVIYINSLVIQSYVKIQNHFKKQKIHLMLESSSGLRVELQHFCDQHKEIMCRKSSLKYYKH